MKAILIPTGRPWFTSPADDVIEVERTDAGYEVTWNGVLVGSVRLMYVFWHPYDADGDEIAGPESDGLSDPLLAAELVCDTYARMAER